MLMPFIVTRWPECLGCLNPSTDPHRVAPPLSRVAVATLEEARDAVVSEWGRFPKRPTPIYEAVRALVDESGGTVGPLPDGTVIEVERVGWTSIYEPLRPFPREKPLMQWTQAEILAAFNTRQAATA